jgi:hypothetical protein
MALRGVDAFDMAAAIAHCGREKAQPVLAEELQDALPRVEDALLMLQSRGAALAAQGINPVSEAPATAARLEACLAVVRASMQTG